MKSVYFLRHGETEGNRTWIHQFPETTLSTRGLQQADCAAAYFRNIPLDLVVASPYERAKQTAEAVAKRRTIPVEYNELFAELRRPREIWGTSWFAPHSLNVMVQLYRNASRENWHYSDEENLEEFHARARRALEFLAHRPEERILVVTHRGFMATLAERMRRDGLDTVAQYRRALWKNLTIGNCCYLTATWTPEGENGTTLDGTWSLKNGTTCPPGVKSRFGLG